MHVKYLKKTLITLQYRITIKVTIYKKIIHMAKIKNVKFSYKSYSIFIHMLGYLLSRYFHPPKT